MAKNTKSITPKSRKKMSPRGKAKKTLMLDAIRSQVDGGEEAFLKRVVEISIGNNGCEATEDSPEVPATLPNPQLLTLVLSRIEPPLKATMPLVNFAFDVGAEPHEQASQVITAVSNGEISPDIGHMFISSIKSMIEIHEFTELKSRIDKIEAILNNESS